MGTKPPSLPRDIRMDDSHPIQGVSPANAPDVLFDVFGRTDLHIPEGLYDQTGEPVPGDTRGCPSGWRTFFSAPYAVTELLPGVVSVVLLTARVPKETHVHALKANVEATRLPTTLVLANGAYFRQDPDRDLVRLTAPPAALLWQDNGIPHSFKSIDSPERFRWYNLYCFGCRFEEADLGHPGHLRLTTEARPEEVERLAGPAVDGVPKGLQRCKTCGEFRGECIDLDNHYQYRLLRIFCCCENDNRSPVSGGLLATAS
jgi:hypothetical protein